MVRIRSTIMLARGWFKHRYSPSSLGHFSHALRIDTSVHGKKDGSRSVQGEEQHSWMRANTVICAALISLATAVLLLHATPAQADVAPTEICPARGIQTAGAGFQPGGIILTSFDRTALWVLDLDSGRRYPLPETSPCGRNCRLSPDARWITYFNHLTNAFNKMRLDGTQRSMVSEYAADVEWWADGVYLIWTPGHQAYLMPDGGASGAAERDYLNVESVISVQPGGHWGVALEPNGEGFERMLVNLELRGMEANGIGDGRVNLGADLAYFNAHGWSPDGRWLAFVAPTLDETGAVIGSELYGISPGDETPVQWTHLTEQMGAARINGLAVGELSWSPDSTRVAYWVMEMTGADPAVDAGAAVIHLFDITTQEETIFCGYSTVEHTPNPPRLIWSPDGTHLAFAGNVPADDKGYLVLVLDVATGQFISLSEGVYPALGAPDLVAWGLPPG